MPWFKAYVQYCAEISNNPSVRYGLLQKYEKKGNNLFKHKLSFSASVEL